MTTEVVAVNSPVTSKINWAAGLSFVAAVLSQLGIVDISPEAQNMIMQAIVFGVMPLIVILRSFFTAKKAYGG